MAETPPSIFVVGPGGMAGRGGMGRLLGYYVRGWRSAGRTPDLTVLDTYGPGPRWQMPVRFALALARLCAAAIRGRVAVLHIHVAERGSLVRKGVVVWLGRLFGIPTVLHAHGAEFAEERRRMGVLARMAADRTLRAADRLVVLGTPWVRFYRDECGVAADRIRTVWNAVPDRGVVEHGRRPVPMLLFLGRLGDRKGVPELLAALAAPGLAALPWRAVLAGDGEVDRFRAAAADRGLADRLAFPGWVDEAAAAALMAEADVLILPSHNEGLPMAILEALARGLPVIATPVGAIGDAITHGVEGLLVAPGDVAGLGAAIERLVRDPARRAALGRNGRRRFEARFGLEAYLAAMAGLYRELGVTESDRLAPPLAFADHPGPRHGG